MNIRFLILCTSLLFLMISCKESKTSVAQNTTKESIDYPAAFVKVIDQHGGLKNWKSHQSMYYEIVKDDGNEKYWIDLNDRRERIEKPNSALGYDGQKFWIEADTSDKTNPVFYKNLMFYFYAMPFVLADPGIHYHEADPLTFDSKEYLGYKISYGDSIGISPKDEYYFYFNPENHQMEWLGYTVTYFSNEKSNSLGWIRYTDWQEMGGLKLPKTLAWYKVENNLPTTERNKRQFDQLMISKDKFPDDQFAPTKDARIIEE